MPKKIASYFTKKIIIGAVVVLVASGLVVSYYASRGNGAAPTIKVARGTVTEEVNVTGKTKPIDEVSLAFERGGRIVSTNVCIGSRVTRWQTLLTLDQSELAAQLAQAKASEQSAEAKLDELKRGPLPENIQVARTEVQEAEQTLTNDYDSVPDKLQDAYASANKAIRKDIDALFTDDESVNVALSFQTTNTQKGIDTLAARAQMSSELNAWSTDLSVAPIADPTVLDSMLDHGINHLTAARNLLNLLNNVVLGFIGSSSTSNTYITAVGTARAEINTAMTSLNTQIQTIDSQKVTVKRLEDELALKLYGTDPQQIKAQEAAVAQQQANVALINAQIAKTVLVSPIDGVVTKQDGKRGEIVAANIILVSIISDTKLEIEANVPEVDVAKIATGNEVQITLDAYPDETFTGTVAHIDPGETIVDGVVNYKIDVVFTDANTSSRVKSGLTANLAIQSAKRENVLVLPQYALLETDNGTFVKRKTQTSTEDILVEIGIRDSRGMTEIKSGVSESDEVLNLAATTGAQ
ncbi:MAG: efflux RND transporter periplasmic adaptor subunit [Candidatus Liptonbacteria bacterium]